jgi:hypothetical protein
MTSSPISLLALLGRFGAKPIWTLSMEGIFPYLSMSIYEKKEIQKTMYKLMTQDELAERPELEEKDKKLIEATLGQLLGTGEKPDSTHANALRGYLFDDLNDSVIDDELRKELDGDAASFDDGWESAFEVTDLKAVKGLRDVLAEAVKELRLHTTSQDLGMKSLIERCEKALAEE